ncbi:hypothetical protein [uncultured Helcococcus sp.]|uniref:hypothetical protein n=1 Tax=uncultured Helcococcus sp. TaxID=1072508 RepID=UPI002614C9D7|nr:hypothetical protein [uncultured Helcococcus sp.]
MYFIVLSMTLDFFEVSMSKSTEMILFYIAGLTLIGTFRDYDFFYTNNTTSYIFIKQMKLDPKKYYLSSYFYQIILNVISFSLIYYIILKIAGGFFGQVNISYLNIISFTMIAYSLRFIVAYIFLKRNLTKDKFKIYNYTIYPLMVILLIGLIVLIGIGKIIDVQVLFNPLMLVLAIVIFGILVFRFMATDNIRYISNNFLVIKDLKSIEEAEIDAMGLQAEDGQIKVDGKDFSSYKGIEYINKIFFYRHKSILKKKVRIGNIIKIAIFIGISIGAVYIRQNANLSIAEDAKNIEEIKSYLPYVIFAASYFMYTGEFFVKYCFYNMDKDLMRHAYYRTSENVLKSIKIRIVELIKYYLLPYLFMLGMILIVCASLSFGYAYTISLLLISFAGLLFFSMHYLYIYYLLQPFTESAKVKNPLYSGLTYVIYMIMYFSGTSDSKDLIFKYILIFVVIYLILGGILVYKFAPKRFKIHD